MDLVRGLHNLRPHHRGCVATIGNFDGVHLGHQAVLGQLAERAAESNLPTVVIIFEPQPGEYFARGVVPPRLSRFREKIQALRRFSVTRVVCLRFGRALAEMAAEDFIRRLLVEGLDVRYLVVGDDFRFGHRRRGDFVMLREAGAEYGFQVAAMHSFKVDGMRASSTAIRNALLQDDLAAAERMLGRPYRMCGRVVHGDERGRTIGFPTANIHLHRRSAAVNGVYAVEVFGLEREPLAGVANVGTRPTVDGRSARLEVHLLDYAQDIYGRYLHIDFLHKLRPERRFGSLEELMGQIGQDAAGARAFHASRLKN